MRWTGERMTGDDILEMVEDREFEGKENVYKSREKVEKIN